MDFSHILNSKKLALSVILSVFLSVFACKSFAIQSENEPGKAKNAEQEAFNPTTAILEHIGDSHYWHLGGHAYIALPVILFTDKGTEMFSADKLEHGGQVYQGKYYAYKLIDDKIKAVDANGNLDKVTSKKIYDFSITKNVIALWIAGILLFIIFFSVASSYKKRTGKAPKGLQSLIEPVILFVRDEIARPNIGYRYQRYMPILLTIFFFIWINNMLGLIPVFPGGANVTGNILLTFVLATIVLLVVNFSANKYYWKHIFLPDVPLWLYPIMIPVELIGIISRPFALMIRLYANISAGHIIVLSLISLIFIFKSLFIAPVSIAFVLFMDVLELLVAFLQAFIFTMLTALFIGTAVEEHHH
ncbi:F0F1 ATP synthase subunit A [Mucilaginibacter sp. KACC 22063]|uniref:F0F1 ATP synthase subunit A n=1 Tax=Mucilaginibacter sp. KACC 22063 TaxID=3025666 RepID=UPI0023663189|nr:F0F1 ATP synthase subunit A [Mucilaginibacter sp. KACC 22063]WDF56242.1 F0F1 ATP synthase subunit A [Mucilaginibacter sp. KACC 22063]